MNELTIARVVIACDAVGENLTSFDAAAALAAAFNAALHGIFVQDEALLHWAALPFARHVGAGGDVLDEFVESALLHHFAAQADRARAAIEAAARAHDVGWSFDVMRGQLDLATLPVGDRDLLVIEAATRPFAGVFRLDLRWFAQAFHSQRPILLVRGSGEAKDGVLAFVNNPGPSLERVIAAAAGLALTGNRPLTVLLAEESVEAAAALERVRAISDELASRCRVERISLDSLSLGHLAGEGSVLVVDADPSVNDAAALQDLTARTRANILFLR